MNRTNPKQYYWFICNSCIWIRRTADGPDRREGLLCPNCGLSARQRSILLAIQKIRLKKRVGRNFQLTGVSDGASIWKVLTSKFKANYKNFEYHIEPRLDITNVESAMECTADIVSCSEVLEHVQPPVEAAFTGLNVILKKGGFCVISVPYREKGHPHIEHFPVLTYSQIDLSGEPKLIGKTATGEIIEFGNLVFHGGAGSTLEYRVFSEDSLRSKLLSSGFVNIEIQKNHRIFGIVWEPWSRVWIAQKPI